MRPYYEHAGITIYHGDCRDFLHLSSDVLVTDPPYGVNLGQHAAARETRGWLAKGPYASYEDTWENFIGIVVPVISSIVPKVKRGIVFSSGSGLQYLPHYDAVGGIFLPSGMGRTRWGFQNFAFCAMYGTAPNLQNGARPTGIQSTHTADKVEHPCPKPYAWMRWAVKLATLPGDLVLDPFMGSGTTLQAAKSLGLPAIGIEIEERYCEIAANRLSQECSTSGPPPKIRWIAGSSMPKCGTAMLRCGIMGVLWTRHHFAMVPEHRKRGWFQAPAPSRKAWNLPNRILRDGIIDSRAINALSDDAELFYRRLMSVVDDFGRFEADPVLLRTKVFPRKSSTWTEERISACLRECSETFYFDRPTGKRLPLIVVYHKFDSVFLEIQNFGQRLRPGVKSKYPDPLAETRGGFPRDAAECGETREKTASRARTPPPTTTPPKGEVQEGEDFTDWFELQYQRHPKKKNRGIAERFAAEAFSAGSFTLDGFEKAHVIWCESDEWAWKNGAAAPSLDQWIVDKGYNYLPKSYAPPVAPEVPLWRKELLARPLEEN